MQLSARTVRDGIIVGLIGFASVAAFYSAFDLLAARGVLFTVDLLGKALLRGLRDPGVIQFPGTLDLWAILAYNAFHLVVSLAIGLVVVGLIAHAERVPSRRLPVVFVLVAGFVVTVVVVGVLTTGVRAFLPWWSIVVANVVAPAGAGMYLLRLRPGVGRFLLMGRPT